jgi:hypothetical protein
MNLGEARDWVEQQVKPLEFSSGEIDRLLNLENDQLARELRFPTRLIRSIDATEAFLPAAGTRPGSVIKVWDDVYGAEIPVYSVQEAHRKFPRWLDADPDLGGAKFVVWEPYNVTAPLTPKGFSAGDLLRVLTIVQPQTMSEDDDLIWDGELPEFHDLVPRKVAADLLIGRSDGVSGEAALVSLIRRGGLLRDEFQLGMRAAFARTWTMAGMR